MDDEAAAAEELPTLYRRILDGVAVLERLGERREAQLIRAQATHAYSSAWNDRTRHRLQGLVRRIDGLATGEARRRPDWLHQSAFILRRTGLLGR